MQDMFIQKEFQKVLGIAIGHKEPNINILVKRVLFDVLSFAVVNKALEQRTTFVKEYAQDLTHLIQLLTVYHVNFAIVPPDVDIEAEGAQGNEVDVKWVEASDLKDFPGWKQVATALTDTPLWIPTSIMKGIVFYFKMLTPHDVALFEKELWEIIPLKEDIHDIISEFKNFKLSALPDPEVDENGNKISPSEFETK